MPALSGICVQRKRSALRLANAVRELANSVDANAKPGDAVTAADTNQMNARM